MNTFPMELLAPAGSYEAMISAVHAGADAVYVGGNKFGARAYAKNFNEHELADAIDYTHIRGKKLYLTVNTLCKDEEFPALYEYMGALYEQGLDGAIVQDVGVIRFIKEHFPDLPIHASTQMTITGAEGAEFLKEIGVTRAVLSRELSLKEIAHIHKTVPEIEIESFIHGALCFAYSGQCLFSSLLGGRSGNRGRCAQPCRLPYELYQGNSCVSDRKNPYLLSLKDLSTIDMIPELVHAGITSFKIEGRMKKPEYTAGVTEIYRRYLDEFIEQPDKKQRIKANDKQLLSELYSRGASSTGYYHCHNGKHMVTLDKPGYQDSNQRLLQHVGEKYKSPNSALPVNGNMKLSLHRRAVLTVRRESREVTCCGETVSEAVNQPLTKDMVKKQILKTGDSPFFFNSLQIEMDDNIYMSVKELNALRRNALSLLEKEITNSYRRKNKSRDNKRPGKTGRPVVGGTEQDIALHASVEQIRQMRPLLPAGKISRVYLDSLCFNSMEETLKGLQESIYECHDAGKECYYIMPTVFRLRTREIFQKSYKDFLRLPLDGLMIRNAEEFQWLKKIGFTKPMILDANVYTFNREAIAFWKEQGISSDTVPLELNSKELKKRGMQSSECMVYGYLPIMTTAQCLKKNFPGCHGGNEMLQIKDRYQKSFMIKNNCMCCYNTIYNSLPLSLHTEAGIIKQKKPKSVRLHFTGESETEVRQITEYYSCLFFSEEENKCPIQIYTKGHFRRGVE